MKKILLTILGLGILLTTYYFAVNKNSVVVFNVGGGNIKEWEKPGKEHLKLKAPKEKILKHTIVKEYKNNSLGGINDFPIIEEEVVTGRSVVEYVYISDILAKVNLYFANGEDMSSGEYISDNKLKFHAERKWYKRGDGSVVDILKATTTLEAFEAQIQVSKIDKIFDFFINTSIATTTYTATTTTYTPPSVGTVNVLIVAGGGGGGGGTGGGGGGGGLIASTSYPVIVQAYDVIVGAGGAKSINNTNSGSKGATSTFGTLVAIGGGGGGVNGVAGGNGGSGGGAGTAGGGAPISGGASTTNQGYPGGESISSAPNYGSGGGGGCSMIGGQGTNTAGGNGGNGCTNNITGSDVVYAGGGGGGTYLGGTLGSGGSGGGGNASSNGTDNLGGGGGGSKNNVNDSGNGGSGVIILQFTAGADPAVLSPAGIILFD